MSRRRPGGWRGLAACLVLAGAGTSLPAQDEEAEAEKDAFTLLSEMLRKDALSSEPGEGVSTSAGGRRITNGTTDIFDLLGGPETANRILHDLAEGNDFWRFLQDFNFQLKTFQADEGRTGLGFAYDYDRDFGLRYLSDTVAHGVIYSLAARGSVAFDADINPEDFLEARASFRYFHSSGGTVAATEETFTELNELEAAAAEYTTDEALRASPEWIRFQEVAQRYLRSQFYFDVGFSGGLESNQSFSRKNWVLGVQGVADFKAWNPESGAAVFNIFDYPFAAVRFFTGMDPDFQVRGFFPTVLVGVDGVSPDDDAGRGAAGDTGSYWRGRTEISFKTPVAMLGDDVYYFTANHRMYQEFSAAAGVKAADLDFSRYLVLTLGGDAGVFLSFSTGKLPFDARNDQIYQIGWQFHF
ncbi:MAG: hypothetical protein EYC70_09395 [Planctomycetota bacterium]|nr:MAG: hypothetical protein EYC70_09395 [Planctomycetota bacterium]